MKQLTTYLLMAIAVAGIVCTIVNLNTIDAYKAEVVKLRAALQEDQSLMQSAGATLKDQSGLMRKTTVSLNEADDLIKQLQNEKQIMGAQLKALYDVCDKHHISPSEVADRMAAQTYKRMDQ